MAKRITIASGGGVAGAVAVVVREGASWGLGRAFDDAYARAITMTAGDWVTVVALIAMIGFPIWGVWPAVRRLLQKKPDPYQLMMNETGEIKLTLQEQERRLGMHLSVIDRRLASIEAGTVVPSSIEGLDGIFSDR